MKFYVDRDEWWPVPEPASDGDELAFWIVEMDEAEAADWRSRWAFAKAELNAFRERLWALDTEKMDDKRQRRHRVTQERIAAFRGATK